jgi:hypothetical protein
MTSPYEGSYDADFEGSCGDTDVDGTLDLDVDDTGAVTGQMVGDDSGPVTGTVDDMGALNLVAEGNSAGVCPFVGLFDVMGDITGSWTCTDLSCTGIWAGGLADDTP